MTPVPDPDKPREKWAEQIRLSHVIRNLMDLFLEKRDMTDSFGSCEEESCLVSKKDEREVKVSTATNADEIKDSTVYDATKYPFITQVDPKQILPYLPLTMADEREIGDVQDRDGRREAAEVLLRKIACNYAGWTDFLPEALRNQDVGMAFLADIMNDAKVKIKVQEELNSKTDQDEESETTYSPEDTAQSKAEKSEEIKITSTEHDRSLGKADTSDQPPGKCVDEVNNLTIIGSHNRCQVTNTTVAKDLKISMTGSHNRFQVETTTVPGGITLNMVGSQNRLQVEAATIGHITFNMIGSQNKLNIDTKHVTEYQSNTTGMQQQTQQIKERTMAEMESRTSGMVKTSHLQEVTVKIENGESFIVLQGRSGAGKTTVACMTLKEMHSMGRNVFIISSPEEFTAVTSVSFRPIMLLDGIFGDVKFDRFEWLKWKPSLRECNNVTVILVGRNDVLSSHSAQMEMCGLVTSYVNLNDIYVQSQHEENINILKANAKVWGIHFDRLEVDYIYMVLYLKEGKRSLGFPLICRILAAFLKAEHKIAIKNIVSTPLEFLHKTIKPFLTITPKLNLLKEMIRMDGSISATQLANMKLTDTAESLEGTLLRKCHGHFSFDHPVIFDSVAFTLSQLDPLFVIENCSLFFIRQRIRIATTADIQQDSTNGSGLVAKIPLLYRKDLAKRYASELTKRNLLQVLSDTLLSDKAFMKEMMSKLKLPFNYLIALTDINSGENFLSLIASNKSIQLLKYIDDKTDVQLNETEMNTVLFGVCKYAASEVLTYLTETSETLDVNIHHGNKRQTALMVSAESHDGQFVNQVLSLNPDLNASDWEGRRILHYVSNNGLDSAAKLAIEKSVDVNVKDWLGHFPLYYACRKGHVNVMILLLGQGAKVDELGVSLLHCACNNNRPQALCCLLEHGADVNNRDEKGQTPLHAAAERGSKQCIDVLLKAGAEVNARSKDGNSPLHEAAKSGSTVSMKSLIEAGSSLNMQNEDGNAPLHTSTGTGLQMCADILLKAGAHINLVNGKGNTPLHTAAAVGSKGCVDILLKSGAEVNIQNKEGNTSVLTATESGSKECVDLLVAAGADVNTQNINGNTPLHTAVVIQCDYMVDSILKAKADVNIQDREGQTPLHRAADITASEQAAPDLETCKELIEHGADINMQDAKGNTALHLLCNIDEDTVLYREWRSLSPSSSFKDQLGSLVKLLVKNGADVNLPNQNGVLSLYDWLQDMI